jgi:hypothetical protein
MRGRSGVLKHTLLEAHFDEHQTPDSCRDRRIWVVAQAFSLCCSRTREHRRSRESTSGAIFDFRREKIASLLLIRSEYQSMSRGTATIG